MYEVNPSPITLPQRLLAESIGTGLLVTVVVGSGIAAQQLSPGNTGLQLISGTDRVGAGHGIGEIVATAGLIALIFPLARTGRHALSAAALGAYIGAAVGLGLVIALFPQHTASPEATAMPGPSTAPAIQETR